jgi:UDP-N-acetylmuramoyl-L-alanyl-D-glutamate--2,6-diaminopimelate ligase
MERLDMELPFNVLIDYMHTEASYEKGLSMVRGLTKGRLITIFGCGGNRDADSRPLITSIVARLSDQALATADNPRSETVEGIFADMRKGNESADNLSFIADRRGAIAAALEIAEPGDTVLIAGKGHETFQEYSDCVVPFDDRAVAREILQNKQWQSR